MPINAQGLLNQLLSTGKAMAGRAGKPSSRDEAGRSGGLGGLVSGLGGGKAALATGLAGMLLRRRGRGRGLLGGLLGRGGTLALGALAYRAYTEWQRQKAGAAAQPRTLDRVSGREAEAHSQAVLKAVIAAAKADGHVDDAERRAIQAEMAKLGEEPEARRWLNEEIARPLDAAEVAAAADSDVVAAEMYLASRLVIDVENPAERAYLDELARQLNLDPALRAQLDRQAARASAH